MGFKTRFEELGKAYLAAVEGAVGCRLDANLPGKTYELGDLTATLRRFYEQWSPESKGLRAGRVMYWSDEDDDEGNHRDLHSADEIEIPLRSQCRNDPGIFIIMDFRDLDRVRSLLMFADAVLFWDPFEEAIGGGGSIDGGVAQLGLSYLKPLRPLIAAGLVVPAQLARTRAPTAQGTVQAGFAANLMWQGALGQEEFDNRLKAVSADEYRLSVPEGPLAAKGWLGHAENKVASLFLPDIVIPLMDYDALSSYQGFCRSIDQGLKARELQYVHQSLAFETGFILDPSKLTNEKLLELRDRDVIFATLRDTILKAMDNYEESVATGNSASYVEEFNIELQRAFRDLKSKALVSNTWKEFVDESRSFSSRFLTKVFSAPLHGKAMFSDVFESFGESSLTSVSNVAVASLKTYTRYRNTKVLMDAAGAIRDNHEQATHISI